ncbi:MAG: M48 family metallopeptidase [Alphaproteobacteria bacterium]|nr:M48 family metallopeptidase [Alphaproteobacteria bacterium]
MSPTATRAPRRLPLSDGRTVELRVRKSRRARRMILRVLPFGAGVEVVLPPGVGEAEGLDFSRRRAGWIQSHLEEQLPRVPFGDGARIPFLGETLILRHCPRMRGAVRREEGELRVAGDMAHLPRRVADWLKARAREEISPRAHGMAERLGRRVERIGLRDPRTRWGSCSAKGGLSFSWRLVLAPVPVLDYVVAHETAHLVEHNHSPAFWGVVEKLVGDPCEQRQWLRRFGPDLHRYG